MKVVIGSNKNDMAEKAAATAAEVIRKAIREKGACRMIVATGASQFEFLQALTAAPDIDWSRVTGFHLDEYVGLPVTHKASFRAYLRERFAGATPVPLAAFHEVNGEAADPAEECRRLDALINAAPVDLACVGIGENGHLAFNDPPADFETEAAYCVVDLDPVCRHQQVGEGWFATMDDVPRQAFSMTIRQIMKSAVIVCTVPDARKAKAVVGAVEGPVTNILPSSIMQKHPEAYIFLDPDSAALLRRG